MRRRGKKQLKRRHKKQFNRGGKKRKGKKEEDEGRRILLIGATGSGKTYLAQSLCAANGLKTYLLDTRKEDKNSSSESESDVIEDDDDLALTKSFKKTGWKGLKRIKNANLVVEDIIRCNQVQRETLQRILNWNCRHRKIKICILNAHQITSNGLFACMENLGEIIIMTKYKSAVKSLRRVAQEFNFSKAEIGEMASKFLADSREFGYWVINLNRHEFFRDGGDLSPPPSKNASSLQQQQQQEQHDSEEKDISQHLRTAKELLPLFSPSGEKAMAVVKFILQRIDINTVAASDLTVTAKMPDKMKRTISLLDYVVATQTVGEQPSRELMLFHVYLKRRIPHMPRCFFSNAYFK